MTEPNIAELEALYQAAVQRYHAATRASVAATDALAFARAVIAFPGTVTLHLRALRVADGIIVRAQKVSDADGNMIAGYDAAGRSDSAAWDEFTDSVDVELYWLSISGDTVLGERDVTGP